MRYKFYRLRYKIRHWLTRQWRLFRASKAERPVLRLVYKKMDEAQQHLVDSIGEKLYGDKQFNGLGDLIDSADEAIRKDSRDLITERKLNEPTPPVKQQRPSRNSRPPLRSVAQ